MSPISQTGLLSVFERTKTGSKKKRHEFPNYLNHSDDRLLGRTSIIWLLGFFIQNSYCESVLNHCDVVH